MEPLPLNTSFENKETTEPSEKEKLEDEDIGFIEAKFMSPIEHRIIEWLDSNHVNMLTDPSSKKDAYFTKQREKTAFYSNKKSFSVKCLSLEESPFYQKRRKSIFSSCQKSEGVESPNKNPKNLKLTSLNANIISIEKITFSETLEEMKRKDDEIQNFSSQSSEISL